MFNLKYKIKTLKKFKFILSVLSILFVIKLIITVTLAVKLNGTMNEKLVYTGDSAGYIAIANNFLTWNLSVPPKRVPFYPAFLALTFLISGDNNPTFVLILQHIIYLITVFIFFKISDLIFTHSKFKWIATILFILCPIFFIFSFRYSSENIAIPMQLISFLFFLKYFQNKENKRIHYLIWSGLTSGIAIMTRPIYLLFPVVLLIILFILKKDDLRNKIKHSLILGIFSYSIVFIWALISWINWGIFSTSGSEPSKLTFVFAYHYEKYARHEPVHWDEFDAFMISLFKNFEKNEGHYPTLKEQIKIKSDYAKGILKKNWGVFFYLPIKYSYKFFQPGTQLYYAYAGINEPDEHVSTTRLSAFLKEGFFKTLWNKLNRGPGIFLYGSYNIVYIIMIFLGLLFGIIPLWKNKQMNWIVVLAFMLFVYTAYICGPMIQARYRVVFFWTFIIISVYGWNEFFKFLRKKMKRQQINTEEK